MLAGDASLLECLGVQASAVAGFNDQLHHAMLDHDDLARLGTPRQAWTTAVAALATVARDRDERTAVFSYCGVHAAGKRSEKRRASQAQDGYQRVAEIIDRLAADAGLATLPPSAEASAA